jgi:hypothetical protein
MALGEGKWQNAKEFPPTACCLQPSLSAQGLPHRRESGHQICPNQMCTSEGLAVAKAFMGIANMKLRRRVVDLVARNFWLGKRSQVNCMERSRRLEH